MTWPRNIVYRGDEGRRVGILDGIGWSRVDGMISVGMLRLLLLHWWLYLQRRPTRTLCSLNKNQLELRSFLRCFWAAHPKPQGSGIYSAAPPSF